MINQVEFARVMADDGAIKLQIRSVTSSLQCASTQTTIIPVLGVFPQRILLGFLSENLAMFGK